LEIRFWRVWRFCSLSLSRAENLTHHDKFWMTWNFGCRKRKWNFDCDWMSRIASTWWFDVKFAEWISRYKNNSQINNNNFNGIKKIILPFFPSIRKQT
jgi:hypothetical protein